VIGVLILAALLLVSCKEDQVDATILDDAPPAISDSTGDEGSQTGEEASPGGEEDSRAVEEEKPEPRTELMATNPESVQLGSGRVTLVEFFAFW
jgi:hypothetical protein